MSEAEANQSAEVQQVEPETAVPAVDAPQPQELQPEPVLAQENQQENQPEPQEKEAELEQKVEAVSEAPQTVAAEVAKVEEVQEVKEQAEKQERPASPIKTREEPSEAPASPRSVRLSPLRPAQTNEANPPPSTAGNLTPSRSCYRRLKKSTQKLPPKLPIFRKRKKHWSRS